MLVLASASPRRQELLRNAADRLSKCRLRISPRTPYLQRVAPGHVPSASLVRRRSRLRVNVHRIACSERTRWWWSMAQLLGQASPTLRTPRACCACFRDTRASGDHGSVRGGRRAAVSSTSETTVVTVSELTGPGDRRLRRQRRADGQGGGVCDPGTRGSRWIPRIEGDYFNVVGLPVALVVRMLRERRVRVLVKIPLAASVLNGEDGAIPT
jgi:septum formation protein